GVGLPDGVGLPAPAASLSGTLYCEKSQRLALHWENGDFELWDTEHGRRCGRVVRLPWPVGWCVASPDEATIVTADRLPNLGTAGSWEALQKGFFATVRVWDAK